MRETNGASLPDERSLLAEVCAGSQEAFARLAARYDGMLTALSHQLVVPALEADDLKQEGLLALLSAARSYREENGAAFATYARLCARRRMISARRRVMALPIPVEGDDTVAEILPDGQAEPEQLVVAKEEERRLFDSLKQQLSPLEYAALCDYLDGYSYEEIAAHIGSTAKSVDNALTRVRRKLQHRF